jgi:hypothetical protein
MHAYDRLMTQYLPILDALTTFIAALDSIAIEHTFAAVRIFGGPPARAGLAVVDLAGKAVPVRTRRNGEGAW